MPACDTLIHLVSDQTMQNLLPVLALSPQRVVQVVSSSTERFHKPAVNTIHASHEAAELGFGYPREWPEPVSLGVDSPTIEQTREVVARLFQQYSGAWMNYTGGTKNMSIGAWLAARDAGAPSLYCDTPREFVPGVPGGPLPPQTLRDVSAKLTVPLILASQGLRKEEHWKRRDLTPQQAALGEASFRLIQQHGNAFRQFRHSLQLHGLSKGGGTATAKDVERVLQEAVPGTDNQAFLEFFTTASSGGLLERSNNQWFYKINPKTTATEKKERVKRIAQELSGTAFEAYVAGMLKNSRKFTNYLSNIHPAGAHPEVHGFGETDFLAYEPASLSLTLISCKCSPPGLEHLEALLARKSRFGGLFARTLLCVEYDVDGNRALKLRSHCKSLGIGCAIGNEIASALGA